jgi:GAF domain-containing protein
MTCPVPPNESDRVAALRALQILDTTPARDFDSVVRLAREFIEVPISAISLVDEHRQWFKAIEGLDCKETAREIAFCAHTICSAEPLIVHPATRDDRFRGNVLVRESPKIRFYAGFRCSLPTASDWAVSA